MTGASTDGGARGRSSSPGFLIAIFCLAQSLAQIGAMAFAALLPAFFAEWSLSHAEAGWLSGIIFGAYAAAVPILLPMTDRTDARKVYMCAVFLNHAVSSRHGLPCGRVLDRPHLPRAERDRLGRHLHGGAQGFGRPSGGAGAIACRRRSRRQHRNQQLVLLRHRWRGDDALRLAGRVHGRGGRGIRRAALGLDVFSSKSEQGETGPGGAAPGFQAGDPQRLGHGLCAGLLRAHLGDVRRPLLAGDLPDLRGGSRRRCAELSGSDDGGDPGGTDRHGLQRSWQRDRAALRPPALDPACLHGIDGAGADGRLHGRAGIWCGGGLPVSSTTP